MANTWPGWESQLLTAAGLNADGGMRAFLDQWNAHKDSLCGNNPIDISRPTQHSTNCQALNIARTAQRYPDHAAAVSAFNIQIHSGNFPNLLAGLKGQVAPPQDNLSLFFGDIEKWGSTKFASFLSAEWGAPIDTGGAGGGGGGIPAGIHKGWHDLQQSVGSGLHSRIHDTNSLDAAALRKLGQLRKVGL